MNADSVEKKRRQNRERQRKYRERESQISKRKLRERVRETTPERKARLAEVSTQAKAIQRTLELTLDQEARLAANSNFQHKRCSNMTQELIWHQYTFNGERLALQPTSQGHTIRNETISFNEGIMKDCSEPMIVTGRFCSAKNVLHECPSNGKFLGCCTKAEHSMTTEMIVPNSAEDSTATNREEISEHSLFQEFEFWVNGVKRILKIPLHSEAETNVEASSEVTNVDPGDVQEAQSCFFSADPIVVDPDLKNDDDALCDPGGIDVVQACSVSADPIVVDHNLNDDDALCVPLSQEERVLTNLFALDAIGYFQNDQSTVPLNNQLHSASHNDQISYNPTTSSLSVPISTVTSSAQVRKVKITTDNNGSCIISVDGLSSNSN